MTESPATARDIIVKTTVVHTVTYFVAGVLAFVLLDYRTLISRSTLAVMMRPLDHPMVVAGPLLQPVRGLLFGAVFFLLRGPFFGRARGWLTMWIVLVAIGILGTFGSPPGSLEGVIYTTVPIGVHGTLLPEVLLQSLLLSYLVYQWVTHRGRRWLGWTLGAAFVLALALPALGLISMAQR